MNTQAATPVNANADSSALDREAIRIATELRWAREQLK